MTVFALSLASLALFIGVWGTRNRASVTILYSFTGEKDGEFPFTKLLEAGDGGFYGSTYQGGAGNEGAIFRLTTNGTITILDSVAGTKGAVVQTKDFNLYGVSWNGGTYRKGSVFRISTNGGFTVLYSFTGANDGETPSAGLVQGDDLGLYGATFRGGSHGNGTIFRITTNSVLTVIYSFKSRADGDSPYGRLVKGTDGVLYGTTSHGGPNNRGAVFKITTNGTFTIMHAFTADDGGSGPLEALLEAPDGDLYGDTMGNMYENGALFKINKNGKFTILHTFQGKNDHDPGELVAGQDGYLYTTTRSSGRYHHGAIVRIGTNGAFTVLHSFRGAPDGSEPQASLVRGSDGYFYGTTGAGGVHEHGTIFRLVIPH